MSLNVFHKSFAILYLSLQIFYAKLCSEGMLTIYFESINIYSCMRALAVCKTRRSDGCFLWSVAWVAVSAVSEVSGQRVKE